MNLSTLLTRLTIIKERLDSGDTRTGGICYWTENLNAWDRNLTQEERKEMYNLFETWPNFSGNTEYPVPCPDGGCPKEAYQGKGKWKGKYGESRKELLQHMIHTLENTTTIEETNMTDAEVLLSRLKKVRTAAHKGQLRVCGVCHWANHIEEGELTLEQNKLMKDLFKTWPNFSGSNEFPVPCPDDGDPCEAFLSTTSKWEGEYGKSRKELLDYMISTLEG